MYSEKILSGIELKYILQYFKAPQFIKTSELCFEHNSCKIVVTPLKTRTLVNTPQNLVVFSGEPSAVQDALWQFRLNFMSAGG